MATYQNRSLNNGDVDEENANRIIRRLLKRELAKEIYQN